MKWLNTVVDEVVARLPEGEILVESGVSPSGTYHVGTLREVLTCDAVMLELKRRGRQAKHVHFVDDLDALRKVPANVPEDYRQHLGKALCDIPAPSGNGSYADFFLNDFLGAAKELGMEMEVVRSHEKYRAGFFVPAIEKALKNEAKIRQILEDVSGHKLDDHWSPVQIMEDEYLKNRKFLALDTVSKKIEYQDADASRQFANYDGGKVKLNWRIDWAARWWLLKINVEPFGRDHATKGGSYDTGSAIAKQVFGSEAPYPVPFNFILMSGETKKMSKSSGNTIAISELTKVMPPEVVRYFTLRYPPEKELFFDRDHGLVKLIDEYSQLLAKPGKTKEEQQLIEICQVGREPTVSSVPFSHLVASYQAALKDPAKTLEIVARTEYEGLASSQAAVIQKELGFIDQWLRKWAPQDVKFELLEAVESEKFDEKQRDYLLKLSQKVEQAPAGADGEWFHKAIYDLATEQGIAPKQAFTTIYQALIGQASGPRAGWFLSTLPREWLIKRLKLLD